MIGDAAHLKPASAKSAMELLRFVALCFFCFVLFCVWRDLGYKCLQMKRGGQTDLVMARNFLV
jgi:hypothetical protein